MRLSRPLTVASILQRIITLSVFVSQDAAVYGKRPQDTEKSRSPKRFMLMQTYYKVALNCIISCLWGGLFRDVAHLSLHSMKSGY